jgi:hypothetical protein
VQCRWIAGNADRGEGEGISPGLKPDCPFSCPTGCSFPLNFQPEPNDPPTFVPKHPQTPRHGPRLFFSLLPCCCSHPLLAFSCLLIRQFSALRHPVAPFCRPPQTLASHQVAALSRPKDLLLHGTPFLQHDITSAQGFHLPQGLGHAGAPVVVYHTNSSNQLALECHQE